VKRKSTIASLFLENVSKYPDKTAFVDVEQNKRLSFTEMNFLCNQVRRDQNSTFCHWKIYLHHTYYKVANYFQKSAKLKKDDVVALFMQNSADYVAIWLGLSKLGVVSSLINYSLRLQSLGHCISVCKAKYLIVDVELQLGEGYDKKVSNKLGKQLCFLLAVEEAITLGYISKEVKILVYGGKVNPMLTNARRLDDVILQCSINEPRVPSELNLRSIHRNDI